MKKVIIEKLEDAYRITAGNLVYRYSREKFNHIILHIKEYFGEDNDKLPRMS